MQIKDFPYDNFEIKEPAQTLILCLEQLFYNKMINLDSVSISLSYQGSIYYIDEIAATKIILNHESFTEELKKNPNTFDLHTFIYNKYKDIKGIVMGAPNILFSLMETETDLGDPTSMMEKRMISSINGHIYPENSLSRQNKELNLNIAREKTDKNNMGHLLMLIKNNFLLSAAPNIFEAATHYQNVEFMAKKRFNELFQFSD
jgi:hypothetical protein